MHDLGCSYCIEYPKAFRECIGMLCQDLVPLLLLIFLGPIFNIQACVFSNLVVQFIREYTGKVDELIKDKIEALKEVKAKESEEKDVIMQQVHLLNQFLLIYGIINLGLCILFGRA